MARPGQHASGVGRCRSPSTLALPALGLPTLANLSRVQYFVTYQRQAMKIRNNNNHTPLPG